MSVRTLICQNTTNLPRPFAEKQAYIGLEAWLSAVPIEERTRAQTFLEDGGRELLSAITGHSPFLSLLLTKQPLLPLEYAARPAAAMLRDITKPLCSTDVGTTLRQKRQQLALLVALADLTGEWPIADTMHAITLFADYAVQTAFKAACQRYKSNGKGLTVFAVGKHGAKELNYSSDIDLLAFYDPDIFTEGSAKPVKIMREIIRLLQEQTAAGYVFRTDFRLRPDPSMTPLAMSLAAATDYYQSMARTWERAALIRARQVAGDKTLGDAFLQLIQPFIWRRSLDFAAVDEIHAIKRQLGGSQEITELAGHNLKIGAGGIREIEFFAQTQQLIWGGKLRGLRSRCTITALQQLAAAQKIPSDTATTLINHYYQLRWFEQRLQMVNDQQTHSLPTDKALDSYASFCGFERVTTLGNTLLPIFNTVENTYNDLFVEEQRTAAPVYDLDDQALAAKLLQQGFQDPSNAQKILNNWHNGAHRVTRLARARELLLDLTPQLLEAAAATSNSDQALLQVDLFISKLAAGIQLFSLLKANPRLLRQLVEIMGESPSLAERLAHRPALIDTLLLKQRNRRLGDREAQANQLRHLLDNSASYEQDLLLLREFCQDEQFLASLPLLQPNPSIAAMCHRLTDIADIAIQEIVPHVIEEFTRGNGLPGNLWILAMGKHGSREMTVNSDLDLVFLYDAPNEAVHYTRLCQRIVSALTVPVSGGTLFAVDTRLRPSGNAGPVAVPLLAFQKYQQENAWTWEHLALTRARVVYGDTDGDAAPVMEIIRDVLATPRKRDAVLADVASMVRKLKAAKKPRHAWHLKHLKGGMLDIELLTQACQLLSAGNKSDHDKTPPTLTLWGTASKLRHYGPLSGVVDKNQAEFIAETYSRWRALQALLRLTLGKQNPAIAASPDLKQKLAELVGAGTFKALNQDREQRAAEVWRILQDVLAF